MLILAVVVSFLAGVLLTGFIAYKVVRRMEEDRDSDPLESPPNQHVYHLREAVRRQIREWEYYDYRLDGRSPETEYAALRALRDSSGGEAVWLVKNGVVTLQNGGTVPIRALLQELENALLVSYKALDESAALILDYADLLPARTLETEGKVLYSRKFAFEFELVRLAKLLDLNPDQNDVAKFGGAALWRRQSRRLFSRETRMPE